MLLKWIFVLWEKVHIIMVYQVGTDGKHFWAR
jgi:hypothetical protein